MDAILLIFPLIMLSTAYFSITRTLWQGMTMERSTKRYAKSTGNPYQHSCKWIFYSRFNYYLWIYFAVQRKSKESFLNSFGLVYFILTQPVFLNETFLNLSPIISSKSNVMAFTLNSTYIIHVCIACEKWIKRIIKYWRK